MKKEESSLPVPSVMMRVSLIFKHVAPVTGTKQTKDTFQLNWLRLYLCLKYVNVGMGCSIGKMYGTVPFTSRCYKTSTSTKVGWGQPLGFDKTQVKNHWSKGESLSRIPLRNFPSAPELMRTDRDERKTMNSVLDGV